MENNLNTILSKQLVEELTKVSNLVEIEKGTEILRDGQYVKVIPILLSGNVKVFIKNEDKELLLYYIKPNESCIMSFSAFIENSPSKVFAVTETNSKIMLLPVSRVNGILKKYSEFNKLFYSLYNERYIDLIKTINSVLFDKLDSRIEAYLKEKSELLNSTKLSITHKQIALDLGSSREVISRVIKKLEKEKKVILHNALIEIINL